MCGIFLSLLPSFVSISDSDREIFRNRGPDSYIERNVDCKDYRLLLISSVLHLRGPELVKQPLCDERYIFQWNGEIFGGDLNVSNDQNDTEQLFKKFHHLDEIPSIISSIEGPFAFALTDILNECIWYGRDAMGRRSLLKHKKEMILSSVIPVSSSSDEWEEVPVGGIFRYNLKTRETEFIQLSKNHFKLNRNQLLTHEYPVLPTIDMLRQSIHKRLAGLKYSGTRSLAVLFSGGVDSSVMAKLIDEMLPSEFAVDLLNVAFQNENFLRSSRRHNDTVDDFNVPDRISGLKAFEELKQINPKRNFRFVCIDISMNQYLEAKSRLKILMRPNDTVLDLSISIALWFAAAGQGYIFEDGQKKPYKRESKIVFVGSGIDEQLGGYSRHRVRWERDGLDGVIDELEIDLARIPYRNLGRDDRCISDCGVEPRFPFLDEQFVQYLSNLPLSQKMNFSLPRGFGEKHLLRLIAKNLGFSDAVAFLPKRAIQFGSKTAKLEGGRGQKGDEKLDCMGRPKDDQ